MAQLVDQALVRATCMVYNFPMLPVTARCKDQILPMRHSNNFTTMQRRMGRVSTRKIISALSFGDNNRVPFSVSTTHLSISLMVSQSALQSVTVLRLVKSLISPSIYGKISLRERNVSSKDLCCWAASIWVAQIRSSM